MQHAFTVPWCACVLQVRRTAMRTLSLVTVPQGGSGAQELVLVLAAKLRDK